MNNAQRTLALIGATLTLSIALSGCVTSWLYEDHVEYEENISSVLISQDKKKIVVIGRKYHYIFDAPTTLVNTLESPIHNKVQAYFSGDFIVDASDHINGLLELRLDEKATDSERSIARSIGIKNSNYFRALSWSSELAGTRYSAQEFTGDTSFYKLNRPYSVRIKGERSAILKAMRVPLTPITVGADGVLILAGVILAPVAIP